MTKTNVYVVIGISKITGDRYVSSIWHRKKDAQKMANDLNGVANTINYIIQPWVVN